MVPNVQNIDKVGISERTHYYESIIPPAMYMLSVEDDRFFINAFQQYGMTGCAYRALSTIAMEPGISQDGLAEYMGVDKATITRTVGKLERLGYITREVNDKDRRARVLKCTEDGDRMMDVIREKRRERRNELFRGIDKDQLDMVAQTLVRMLKNVQL